MSMNENKKNAMRTELAKTISVKTTEFGTIVAKNQVVYVSGETEMCANRFVPGSYPKAVCCEDRFTILNSYDFPYEFQHENDLIVRGVKFVPEYGNSSRYIEKEESVTADGAEELIDNILENRGILVSMQNITDVAPPIPTEADNELCANTSPYEMFASDNIAEVFNNETLARINAAIASNAENENSDMFVLLGDGSTCKSPCVVFVEHNSSETIYFIQTVVFYYKDGAPVARRFLNLKLQYHTLVDGEFMSGNEIPVVSTADGYTIIDETGKKYSDEDIESLTTLEPTDDGRSYQLYICGEKFVVDFIDDNTMQNLISNIIDYNCATWVKRCTTFATDELLDKLSASIDHIINTGEESDALLSTDGIDEKVVTLVDAISQRITSPRLNMPDTIPSITEYYILKAKEAEAKINSMFENETEFAL